jgi:hypothetical protein
VSQRPTPLAHASLSPLLTRFSPPPAAFEDAVGRCERLLRTPIPLSYTRHTSRFMVRSAGAGPRLRCSFPPVWLVALSCPALLCMRMCLPSLGQLTHPSCSPTLNPTCTDAQRHPSQHTRSTDTIIHIFSYAMFCAPPCSL